MLRALRSIVVSLLLIALPMQGIAAVAMIHCGPTHERMDGVASAASPAAAGMHSHPSGEPAHDHAAAIADDHARAAPYDDPPAPRDQGDFTCASCAACCAGAAIVDSLPPLVQPSVADAGASLRVPVRYSDPVRDRLERPPHAVPV